MREPELLRLCGKKENFRLRSQPRKIISARLRLLTVKDSNQAILSPEVG
jgi:hypothetical protein